jgi:hypothetical protein
MDQVTQQNAALVEESAAAAESMEEQARELASAVAVFKLAGAAAAGVPEPADATWNGTERRGQSRARNVVRPKFGQGLAAKTPSRVVAAPRRTGTDDDWAEF